MKIILKEETIITRISDLIAKEVHLKNLSDSSVECILLTEDEALDLWRWGLTHNVTFKSLLDRVFSSNKEKLKEIQNSVIFGLQIKVEGLD